MTRSQPVRAAERDFWWVAHALILAAIGFNAVLCLVNTHLTGITSRTVILSEVLIVGATVIACYKQLNLLYVFLLAGTVFLTLTLALIRANISPEAGLDVKIARDLLIPIVFFMLGQRTNNVRCADAIVTKSLIIILPFALFEYFSLDNFLRVFGVAQYYIARGTLELSNWALDVAGGLMASGMRPPEQGRGLLPFLGDHRVSSIFLEPIGLGNYGLIVVMWAIVRSRMEHKIYWLTIITGLALIVLSDTRFDAYFLVLGIAVMMLTPRSGTLAIGVMPFAIMTGLILLYLFYAAEVPDTPYVGGLSNLDRLIYSGRVLATFDLYNWLGVKISNLQTFDAGYAYMISNIGIYGFIIYWCAFMSTNAANRFFYSFRNMSGAFFSALFCVSASQLTIKTAALQWFLMGTLAVYGKNGRAMSARDPSAGLPAAGP
jgi:putative polymerase